MFSFMPPGGDMPHNPASREAGKAEASDTFTKILMDQIKARMEEEADDNNTFDHVPRSGDDVGA